MKAMQDVRICAAVAAMSLFGAGAADAATVVTQFKANGASASKKIPRQSQSFTGTSTFVFGGFSNKLTGSQDSDSANTTGTLNGATLPTNSSSFIGSTKTSQIIISRN